MEPVTIKGLTFGAGLPKICVPLTAPTLPKLIAEAENAAAHRGKDADLCEWRVDSYIYRNTAAVREAQPASTKMEAISRLSAMVEQAP